MYCEAICKMDTKFQQRNIFESGFDSFEFDDGFLLKVDADLKKNSLNKRNLSSCKNVSSNKVEKSCLKVKENSENLDKKIKYYDTPLFIEDLDESDFFDFSKTKSQTAKRKVNGSNYKNSKEKNQCIRNTLNNCVSPVLSCKSFNKTIVNSSTPLKSIDDLDSDKVQKTNKKELNNGGKSSQLDYLEADLFDDWDLDEIEKAGNGRETVTLSQALELIEEAKSGIEKESKDAKALNDSIDLLTGEIVGADVKNLFAESFDLMNSVEKADGRGKKDSSDDSVVVIEGNVRSKPSAAQKLKFVCENACTSGGEKKNIFQSICFGSDDDFDFISDDLLGKGKKKQKQSKPDESGVKVCSVINKKIKSEKRIKNYDSNESSEDIINVKKRKNLNLIISDSSDSENSIPQFHRKKKSRRPRNFQDDSENEFLDLEAEVSEKEGGEVSSDEVEEEEDGEYERSFVDEESYLSQNISADMTAKYLQSVKGLNNPGAFKIPEIKPYVPENIFSQIPEENNTDYQIDSFCVNDVEEDMKTDLSDLEIAEQILEMDEKNRKKRSNKSKKKSDN